MRLHRILSAIGFLSLMHVLLSAAEAPATPDGASVDEQIAAASEIIRPAVAEAEQLSGQGKFTEADTRINGVFPTATRTPVQALVLGNVLFKAQPALSYKLHQEAAARLPANANALLEWALEQHRAKHYPDAARTYAAFTKLKPDYAPALGLAAECALRTGDLAGAVALWRASENARSGTLEQFESLVCEVNGRLPNEATRRVLMERAEKGDEAAAGELLLLDAAWPSDWWTTEPQVERLRYDTAVVNRKFPQPSPALRAALCVAECELLDDAEALKTTLLSRGYLLDARATLPPGGKALSHLLQLALTHDLLTSGEARARLGERVLASARQSRDAELYNVAANLYLESDRLAEIDQAGWDATGDARFAASRISGLLGEKKLSLSDPLLRRALKEFPENSEIAAVAVQLASADRANLQPHVVNAIKAEYTQFSAGRPGVDLPRPSAFPVRAYFALLGELLGK